jgi:pimeloyl-ACP methyl ester carboxylesterase
MEKTPIVLVPGFWLGAWAWDEVKPLLESAGHEVTAVTLPGLESAAADRSTVTFDDHVTAIREAIESAGEPVVLVVHSGAGAPGYAVTDLVPHLVDAVVYVDTGPANGALDPEFEGDEWPLPEWEDLDENIDGISEEQLATWRERAAPEPAGAIRGSAVLSNDERLRIPSTVVCTSFTSDQYKEAIVAGYSFVGGLAELHDVTYLDMPGSHWPMWSAPRELTEVIVDVAS